MLICTSSLEHGEPCFDYYLFSNDYVMPNPCAYLSWLPFRLLSVSLERMPWKMLKFKRMIGENLPSRTSPTYQHPYWCEEVSGKRACAEAVGGLGCSMWKTAWMQSNDWSSRKYGNGLTGSSLLLRSRAPGTWSCRQILAWTLGPRCGAKSVPLGHEHRRGYQYEVGGHGHDHGNHLRFLGAYYLEADFSAALEYSSPEVNFSAEVGTLRL